MAFLSQILLGDVALKVCSVLVGVLFDLWTDWVDQVAIRTPLFARVTSVRCCCCVTKLLLLVLITGFQRRFQLCVSIITLSLEGVGVRGDRESRCLLLEPCVLVHNLVLLLAKVWRL